MSQQIYRLLTASQYSQKSSARDYFTHLARQTDEDGTPARDTQKKGKQKSKNISDSVAPLPTVLVKKNAITNPIISHLSSFDY